jgi:hypothetical protein
MELLAKPVNGFLQIWYGSRFNIFFKLFRIWMIGKVKKNQYFCVDMGEFN